MPWETAYEAISVHYSCEYGNEEATGLSELNRLLKTRESVKIDRVDKLSDSMLIYIISYRYYKG